LEKGKLKNILKNYNNLYSVGPFLKKIRKINRPENDFWLNKSKLIKNNKKSVLL
jgi:hypothetical protein